MPATRCSPPPPRGRSTSAPSTRPAARPDAKGDDPIARFAGQRLAADARIAAFSIVGWDTHVGQANAMVGPLGRLARAITTLADTLGPAWDRTLVVAMTEFGRTARENGSAGTDHGTGGAALLAGGALAGGRVYGDWPGLAEDALYQGRDLMPTADVRHYPALALAGAVRARSRRARPRHFPGPRPRRRAAVPRLKRPSPQPVRVAD